ncbi:MAG: GIY-YIG nuclease family protein [Candidatus Nucleicultricaceae bacterium]
MEPASSDHCWYVYMIRAADHSLYTGITTDPKRRFEEHRSQGSKTAKYLKGKAPLQLVYCEKIASKEEALKREHAIKSMRKKQKEDLIQAIIDINSL